MSRVWYTSFIKSGRRIKVFDHRNSRKQTHVYVFRYSFPPELLWLHQITHCINFYYQERKGVTFSLWPSWSLWPKSVIRLILTIPLFLQLIEYTAISLAGRHILIPMMAPRFHVWGTPLWHLSSKSFKNPPRIPVLNILFLPSCCFFLFFYKTQNYIFSQ